MVKDMSESKAEKIKSLRLLVAVTCFAVLLGFNFHYAVLQPDLQPTPTVTITPTPTATASPENPLITKANAAQLKPLRTWQAHVGYVSSLSFSPNNLHLVSTGDDMAQGTSPIRVWERNNGQPVDITFEGIPAFASSPEAHYSPDGQYILGMASSPTIWNASDGKRQARIGQDGIRIDFAQKTMDYRIVVGRSDGLIGIWNVPLMGPITPEAAMMGLTIEDVAEYQKEKLFTAYQIGEPLIDLAANPHKDQVFALMGNGSLNIVTWEAFENGTIIKTKSETITPEPQAEPVEPIGTGGSKITFDPHENVLAFADNHRDVMLWNTEKRETIARYASQEPITCITFNPNGELLIVTNYAVASTIQVLDSSIGDVLMTLNPENSIMSCAFSPDGTLLATGSADGMITIWGLPA
jgi:WD40 repeat protein